MHQVGDWEAGHKGMNCTLVEDSHKYNLYEAMFSWSSLVTSLKKLSFRLDECSLACHWEATLEMRNGNFW